MMLHEVTRLALLAPLWYARDRGPGPFDGPAAGPGEDRLYCFEVDPSQARRFEPDVEALLGRVVFAGAATGARENGPGDGVAELPAGIYFFTQAAAPADGEALRTLVLEMARETQQEALWRREEPAGRVYLRRLWEDGRGVAQVYRGVDPRPGAYELGEGAG